MNIYSRIRMCRENLGMTQQELADKVGYKSRSTINKIEQGLRDINQSQIAEFARALDVTPSYLMGWDKQSDQFILPPLDLAMFGENKRRIPLLGTIPAGIPVLAVENHDDYFEADPRIKADFALKVKGDSMMGANINSGDIAFFKEQPQIDSGEIGAFLIDGEATLKRFREISSEIKLLESENPNYKPILLNNGSEIRVLGKLAAVLNIRSK